MEQINKLNNTLIKQLLMSFIIIEGKYGAIDTDDFSFHSYYIIKLSSSTYTLQSYLSIDGKVNSYF